jgi:hypothetical protein
MWARKLFVLPTGAIGSRPLRQILVSSAQSGRSAAVVLWESRRCFHGGHDAVRLRQRKCVLSDVFFSALLHRLRSEFLQERRARPIGEAYELIDEGDWEKRILINITSQGFNLGEYS